MTVSKNIKSSRTIAVESVLLGLLFSSLLCFYLDRTSGSEVNAAFLENFSFVNVFLNLKYCILFLLSTVLVSIWMLYGKKISDFVYKYRYLLCILVFFACIYFEINGSSIGVWNSEAFLGGEDTGLIAGASRMARSDEWFVSTPMALSQYHNPGGAFPYFSTVVRGTVTDVFLEYGQPVRDIAVLFRPFHWGYLIFSAGKGLAFFWCGRWLMLFMVSFEMGMVITEKNRALSLGYALLMVLSPTVQWWFAVNGLVEMLVYAQLSILMLRIYLTKQNTIVRAVSAEVIFICAGGFILTLYPAWMMPIALVLLGLIIWQFLENLRYCRLHKVDVLILVFEAVVFAAILAHVFLNSKGTIDALFNTVYPGSRFETGGGEGHNLFNYLSEIWYAMLGSGTMVNVSESSQFIDFFPLCYILPLIVLIRDKVWDKLLLVLLVFGIFLEVYAVVGIPDLLATLSLMGFSTAHRTLQVAGFCNLLLLFRSISLMKKEMHPIVAGVLAILLAVGGIYQNYHIYGEFYQGRMLLAVISCLVFIPCFWYLMGAAAEQKRSVLVCLLACIALLSGVLANPIRRGVKNVTENENILEIETVVHSDPTGVWAIEGLGVPMINAGIIAGAPTINSTNIYPDLDRWRTIDGGEHEDIYNRYAHILVSLQPEGEVSFEKIGEDYFQVNCTVADLQKMGVTYVLTGKDLNGFVTESENLTLMRSWGNYRVYKI